MKRAQIPKGVSGHTARIGAGKHDQNPYLTALTDPFSDDAEGARVPDLFSASTITAKIRTSIPVLSSAVGVVNCAFIADPFTQIVSQTGSFAGLTPYAGSTTYGYAETPATLASLFSTVRVVAAGIRITSPLALTSATGRIFVGACNPAGWIPGPTKLNTAALNGNSCIQAIMGTVGLPQTNILALPDCVETPVASLVSNCIEIPFRPVAPDAFQFKNAGDHYAVAANTYAGSWLYNGVPAPLGNTGDHYSVEKMGWEYLVIYADGVPNTSVCFDVELIIHLEGTPFVASGTGTVAVPTQTQKSPVSMSAFETAIRAAQDFDYAGAIKTASNVASSALKVGAMIGGALL